MPPYRMGRVWLLLLGSLALTACGGAASPPETPPRQETVFDPMLQQKDKAKQQAAEMEKRKVQLDAQLEGQER